MRCRKDSSVPFSDLMLLGSRSTALGGEGHGHIQSQASQDSDGPTYAQNCHGHVISIYQLLTKHPTCGEQRGEVDSN
jgi:hypothetical protein